MRIIECGRQNKDVVILLHGTGVSWWNYRNVAIKLNQKYHVIMPVLDGHAGSGSNFIDIESNARKIISYIDRHYGGSVLLIGGMSLGGQILTEILSVRKDICKYAIIESTLVLPMKLRKTLVKPIADIKNALPQINSVSLAHFNLMKIDKRLYRFFKKDFAKITKKNYTAILRAGSDYKVKQSLSQTNAKVHILVGDRESWPVKGSAILLNTLIRGSSLTIYPDYRFGDISINHPDEYVDKINKIIERDK